MMGILSCCCVMRIAYYEGNDFMKIVRFGMSLLACSFIAGGAAVAAPASSGKLSFLACHKAFSDAKKAGTLNGQSYSQFKQDRCSGSAQTASVGRAPASVTPAAAPVVSGDAVFPAQINPQLASLAPGKARMETCLAQYRANKAAGKNGGLKWVQKGGGYYSQCNARLKGAATR